MSAPTAKGTSLSGLRVVTKGTLVYFGATLFFVAAAFVVRVLLVRTLSAADWDKFSEATAIASSVATVAGFGLANTLARNIPYSTSDNERRAIVRTGLLVGGLSCAVIPVALYIAGPSLAASLNAGNLKLGIEVLGLGYGLASAVALFASVFQGFEDVWPGALFAQVVGPGTFVGLLLGLDLLPGQLLTFEAALWSFVAAWAATLVLIVAYTLVRLPGHLPRGPRTPGRTVPLLLFALPLLGVTVLSYLDGYADTIVLGVFHFSEVGTYVASLTLARLIPIGITALSFIMLPVTARLLREGDRVHAELTYTTTTKWTTLFGLPLFLLFALAPGRSLFLVYGQAYTSVTAPLIIVATGGFLSTIVGPSAAVLISVGRTRLLFVNAIVSLVVDIAVAVVLIPGSGMTGAAVAWALATLVYPALAIVELAVIVRIHPFRRTYLVPLLATGIPCAIALALVPVSRLSVWWLPIIGVGVAVLYGAMVLITRCVDAGDVLLLDILERLLQRRLGMIRRWMAWGSQLSR